MMFSRAMIATLMFTPALVRADAGPRCERQLVLPGILRPRGVPARTSVALDLKRLTERGAAYGGLNNADLLAALRRDAGPGFWITPTSVPRVATEARRGRPASPALRARLDPDHHWGVGTRLMFGAGADDFAAEGADLVTTLRDAAGAAAVGDHVLRAQRLSLERFAPLTPVLHDLAERAARYTGPKANAVQTARVSLKSEVQPSLDRTTADLITEMLNTVGAPTPATYARARTRRGVLVVLTAGAIRGRRVVADRVNEIGSVLVLPKDDQIAAEHIFAIVPLD